MSRALMALRTMRIGVYIYRYLYIRVMYIYIVSVCVYNVYAYIYQFTYLCVVRIKTERHWNVYAHAPDTPASSVHSELARERVKSTAAK